MMPTEIVRTRFQWRRDTAANWASINPVLLLAEPGLETDTGNIKYGDGVSAWNSLPYASSGGGGGGGGGANLSVTTRTATTLTVASDSGSDAVIPASSSTEAGLMTAAQNTKLAGIATSATANASDAQLRDRLTHTGEQAASTISDFAAATRAQIEASLVQGANFTITPAGSGASRTFTLAASGGGGFDPAAPGAIGGTTPADGTFTTLVAGSATSLLLGTAGTAVGSVGFRNATSGTITVQPTTGALGTNTVTLPAVTGTAVVAATSTTTTQALFATATAGAPAFRAIAAGDIPTLNQNTTGSAATLTTSRTIGGSSFNGSANVTSFPSPGAIGGTTPSSGIFTTLEARSATSLLLGTAGTAVGSVGFRNATSGTITIAPPTGALGTVTQTLQAVAGTIAVRIASGTAALGTTAIASGASATLVTVAATGVAATDAIGWSPNVNPNGVTGYNAASVAGCLVIDAWCTTDNVNFLVSNPTTASITPGALTLNWQVIR